MDSLWTWETEVYEIGPGQVRGMAFDLEDRRLALSDEDKISILDLDSGPVAYCAPYTTVAATPTTTWPRCQQEAHQAIEDAENVAVIIQQWLEQQSS